MTVNKSEQVFLYSMGLFNFYIVVFTVQASSISYDNLNNVQMSYLKS